MYINLYNESLFGDGGGDTPANIQPVKSVTITQNGTTSVAPDAGFDGLEGVSIETNVAPKLQTKSVNVTQNGTTSVAPDARFDGLSKVYFAVNVQSSGVGYPASDAKGVFFFDYDGTPLYSYTVEEAQALAELPAVPTTHEHLTADGWTHTLDQVKAVNERLDVGALYRPAKGQVSIIVNIPYDNMEVLLPVWGADMIQWGDSLITTAPTSQPSHVYTRAGVYNIMCMGIIRFESSTSTILQYGCIQEISIEPRGDSTTIPDNAFQGMVGLRRIALARGWTSVGAYAFNEDYNLDSIIIPPTVTSLGQHSFGNCVGLKCVVISESCKMFGVNVFEATRKLSEVVIPPSCEYLDSMIFQASGIQHVTLPLNLKIIWNSVFSYCDSLINVKIPDTINKIYWGTFNDCYALTRLELPAAVSEINGNDAFSGCRNMQVLIIKNSTPPILADVDAFSLNPAQFYVPDASVEAYKAATNWVTLADRIHPMSEIGL